MRRLRVLELSIAVGMGLLSGCGIGGTSSTGTEELDCSGDPTLENTIEQCGVFVRADSTSESQDGTREHPHASLQAAIDAASTAKKRVFACAGAAFGEAVVLPASIEVWGGLDCENDWRYEPTARTVVMGLPDTPAFVLGSGAGGAIISNLIITAADATKPSGSSVAVAAEATDERSWFVRCDFLAGNGADGEDGAAAQGTAKAGTAAASTPEAGGATAACVADVSGGDPGATECEDGTTSGGKGGSGGLAPSGPGDSGTGGLPMPVPNSELFGLGGNGQVGAPACTDGTPGAEGVSGEGGLGGVERGLLTIHGIMPVDGTRGAAGARGQGGGGGGAARAGMFCKAGASTVPGAGASGGGGGAGGCGGKGGNPGRAGGSSVGLASVGGDVFLRDVTITTGKGGRGGNGAGGQPGGAGANGAGGGQSSGVGTSLDGCSGGSGGAGGPGGSGGGGRGGHSVGMAYLLPPPSFSGMQYYLGEAGPGGTGGPGNEMAGQGAAGAREEQRNYTPM